MNPKTLIRIFTVLVFACASWAQTAGRSAITPVAEKQTLAPGVSYQHISSTTHDGEPWSIHVLEVSRKQPGVKVGVGSGRGPDHPMEMQRELPTEIGARAIAAGEKILALVNGDYDAMPYLGVSVGPSVTAGRLWTAGGKSTWPAFALLSDGGAVIGTPHFTAKLRSRARAWRISTLNKSPALSSGLAIYTRDFRANLKAERPFRAITMETIMPALPWKVGSTVWAVVKSNSPATNEIAIPEDAFVLVAPDASGSDAQSLTMLRPEQKVELRLNFDIDGKKDIVDAIGGFPIIVHNGRREIIGNPSAGHSKRHPRTAVCYNDGSVIMAVVDGRQPKLSVGMTLEELGDFMVSLGCQEAMNTDGGGSSVMAIAGAGEKRLTIVNSPSDGKERGRGNALLVESGVNVGTSTHVPY